VQNFKIRFFIDFRKTKEMTKSLRMLSSKSAITRIQAIFVIILVAVVAFIGGSYYQIGSNPPSQDNSSPQPKAPPSLTPISSPTHSTYTPGVSPTSITTPTNIPSQPPSPSPTINSASSATQTPTPTSASPTSTPATSPPSSSTPTPIPVQSETPYVAPTPIKTPTPTPTPTPAPTPIPKYSLAEALIAGYIEANITGYKLGSSSGDSIILDLKRLVNYTIEIEKFPTGTLLVANGKEQSMAILRLKGLFDFLRDGYYARDKIILDSTNKVSYLFSGYCVSFSKPNPSIITRFSVSGTADADVLKIFGVLGQLPDNVTGVAAVQTAVFVVTDNVSLSELESRFSSGVVEIQNARTILEAAGVNVSSKKLFA
jgi:hypothetical protein